MHPRRHAVSSARSVKPRVSVVLPTRERPARLRLQIAALRAQTLPDEQYEIIVVDDGSGPETARLLEAESAREDGPALRVVRRAVAGGAAAARNSGWRLARAPLVAFTDDDCEATQRWLEAGLAAWGEEPQRFVQGPTLPNPREAHRIGPLCHTLDVRRLGPRWETANIFYPREGLELIGGLDERSFRRTGEDVDLGWRMVAAGYEPVWEPKAVVHHAVVRLGRIGVVRFAWRWDETALVYKRHPQLRSGLTANVFWLPRHWWLIRAAVALLLPRRLWWLRWGLAAPYFVRLGEPRPDIVPWVVAADLVELAACARGAIRYRTLVL